MSGTVLVILIVVLTLAAWAIIVRAMCRPIHDDSLDAMRYGAATRATPTERQERE